VAADMQETHRSGPLKQSNKGHKTGKHRSKGAVDAANRGRVAPKDAASLSGKRSGRVVVARQARKLQLVQKRAKKREEALARKRQVGGVANGGGNEQKFFPPVLVAVVSLTPGLQANADELVALLEKSCPEATATRNGLGRLHLAVPRFKRRFSFLTPPVDDEHAVLDACKVADTAVILLSVADDVDEEAERLLTAILSQGLPSEPVFVVVDLDTLAAKRRGEAKKALLKSLGKRFTVDKLHTVASEQEGLLFLRHLGEQKRKASNLRAKRAHMVAEVVSSSEDAGGANCTLRVTGYVRGGDAVAGLSVNRLVHLPGMGSFQLEKIESAVDAHPLTKRKNRVNADCEMAADDEAAKVLAVPDPEQQESLVEENEPDMFDGEQYLSPEDEAAAAGSVSSTDGAQKEKKRVLRVPKGTSEYQAAWIPDVEEVEDEEDEDDDEESDEDMLEAESQADSGAEEIEGAEEANDEEYETMTIASEPNEDANYDEKHGVTFAEEEKALKRLKEERSDAMFPDEVDTPMEAPARVRFQKYRGLASFRSSPWDPKENLPSDYARIFQFENFNRTRKRVLIDAAEEGAEAPIGSYVTLHVKDVPRHLLAPYLSSQRDLILYSMLPHEAKMSVLNFVVKRSTVGSNEAVRSKERLVFHCGYRRFAAEPVFSQHTNGSKHKYERYWREGDTVVMTVYAPILFPPASVLVYKEAADGSQHLLGTGSLLSVDPDRLVVKRAVLSGHPFKIRKRVTTVRFMFFNREDIAWFSPVELRTKWGRRGHIKEPLGTHGHMKCTFDKQLTQQDTVLMNLYKRVYPKWKYDPHVASPASEVSPAVAMEASDTLQLSKAKKQDTAAMDED